MKKSIKTFLKHPTKDNSNRSANPAVIRASTILFNTMQELYLHEKKIKKHQKVSHYSYGRYGSSTTIELENMLKELLHHLQIKFALVESSLFVVMKKKSL